MYIVGGGKTARQCIKEFYQKHGPCCAGCDHWDPIGAAAGECTRTAPVSGAERISMLGMESCKLSVEAGQIITPRDHVCGEFVETDTW